MEVGDSLFFYIYKTDNPPGYGCELSSTRRTEPHLVEVEERFFQFLRRNNGIYSVDFDKDLLIENLIPIAPEEVIPDPEPLEADLLKERLAMHEQLLTELILEVIPSLTNQEVK